MARKRFSAPVQSQGPAGALSSITVPFSVEREWRSAGPIVVKGTLNGQSVRTSLVPNGDGSHHMVLGKDLMAKAKCFVGDTVRVVLEPDRDAGRPASAVPKARSRPKRARAEVDGSATAA
ncbi:MAG TPA: DUF1905 domain-containing protein, partial [Candidatus Thermoplasmatota archaeon]|nr:DUF1905 domain-containing protein [Candidatus Thermoplasmatota archaeon]